jgi:diacylglycerol kinase (ATP)
VSNIDEIYIIYNPVSTGDSQKNARKLYTQLKKRMPKKTIIELIKTEYAGHAEEIAKRIGTKGKKTLIVSSSGDGGYNEVINGALKNPNKTVMTGLIPSGNANDHHRGLTNGQFVEDVVAGRTMKIELLKVNAKINGRRWQRYAHSYIGIGLSPAIGKELTKAKLNFFNEKWLLLKFFFKYTHAKIIVNREVRSYSSLIFSSVSVMSKVIKLSKNVAPNDGKFQVSSIYHQNKLRVLSWLLIATTRGLEEHATTSRYKFKSIKSLPIQLDGEVFTIDKNTRVTITGEKNALVCIV